MKKIFVTVLSVLMGVSVMFASLYQTKNSVSAVYKPELGQGIVDVTDKVAGRIDYENVMRDYGFEDFATDFSGPKSIIVELEDNSVLEEFNALPATSIYNSAADFAASAKGLQISSYLKGRQNTFLSRLKREKIDYAFQYNYSGIINGVAITVDYDDIAAISKIRGVKNVIYSETYYTPSAEAVMNDVNAYSTGIYDTTGINYTGAGMVVAILDTGLDYTHNAFTTIPEVQALTLKNVEKAVSDGNLSASSLMEGVTASELYKNGKVPFQFDYADKDADVYPVTSSHGTHVAGIIAGYEKKVDYDILPSDDNMYFDTDEDGNKTFKGVAVDAQLAILKVFSDLGETGAKTEDIIAALNDAVIIGVDVINMSLGSSGGFSRVSDDEAVNEVYDRIREAGITLAVAAGNEYSSSYGGTYGNTNLTSNPDSSTVGSPAVYNGTISVASISGQLSPYFLVNGKVATYFSNARDAAGKDYNFNELLLGGASKKTYNYVVVGGYGEAHNYNAEIRAKLAAGNCIAVVSRGTTSFEDKQSVAADYGAVACIIYNNVSGVINASLGAGYKIPTCTITNDIARQFIDTKEGTIELDASYKAGPFMSEFSSWGVSPDLHLYPDITAHGGYITSAILGGYGVFSGTSMATPNIAGISTLIRQYLVEKFPAKKKVEINDMLYQLLMSTATIALNEDGNPYSPRKQGAGLADIKNTMAADAYLYVENDNKTKIELGDDPTKTGDYYLRFNIKNLSALQRKYTMSSYVMTEKVSGDGITVAEKAYLFNDANVRITGAESGVTYSGNTVTVAPYADATVTVRVTLTASDKKYLDDNFANGMFVEGYLMFADGTAGVTSRVNLNVPFMGFYGDWLAAPMFDYSAYDVSASKYDDSVLEEDKLQADVYETVVIGRYSNDSYMPMGSYVYNLPDNVDSGIESSVDKIAVGNSEYGIYELYGVYAGLLRGAKTMDIVVTDTVTGEVVFTRTDYEVRKSLGGHPGPIYIELSPSELNMNNNTKYSVSLKGALDYANGENANRNTWSFSFYVDYERPVVVDTEINVSYDNNNNKSVSLTLDLYDNHYIQAMALFTLGEDVSQPEDSDERYPLELLQEYFTPVNSVFNGITRVTIDITNYLENFINGKDDSANDLGIYLIDYAINSGAYLIPIKWDDISDLSVTDSNGKELCDYEEPIEIPVGTPFNFKVSVADKGDHEAVNYVLSNPEVATIKDGVIFGKKEGTSTVTVTEKNDTGTPEVYKFEIKVVANTDIPTYEISRITFASYTTEYGTDIVIGNNYTSLRCGVTAKVNLDFNPWYATNTVNGVDVIWTSLTPRTVSVTDDGVITTLNQGIGRVRVTWTYRGVVSEAMLTISIGEKYTVSGGYLNYYRGADKVLQIPANLGIINLSYYSDNSEGPFYQDKNIKVAVVPSGVTSIGYKTFAECTNLETIYLPATLEGISESAFAGCTNLKNVYWYTNAYYNADLGYYTFGANDNTPCFDADGNYMGGFTGFGGVVANSVSGLKKCTSKNIYLWDYTFDGCYNLKEFDLSKTTAVYSYAFRNCRSLTSVDVSNVKNCGTGAFYNCNNIETATFGADTVIGNSMFEGCIKLGGITLYSENVGERAFYGCSALKSVTFNADIDTIGDYAFGKCLNLTAVEFNRHTVGKLGTYAFTGCTSLARFNAYVKEVGVRAFDSCFKLTDVTLDGTSVLGDYAFFGCAYLGSVTFGSDVTLETVGSSPFYNTSVTSFNVSSQHRYLSAVTVKAGANYYTLLYNADGSVLKIAPPDYAPDGYSFYNFYNGTQVLEEIGASAYANSAIELKDGTLIIPEGVKRIGDFAFGFNTFKTVILPESLEELGEGVFYGCSDLERVVFLGNKVTELPARTFYNCSLLSAVALPENLESIGAGAFANCNGLIDINIPASVVSIGNSAFINAQSLVSVEFERGSQLSEIGSMAFAGCGFKNIDLPLNLKTIGNAAFFYCQNLRSITVPGSVENWGAFAFSMCTSLSEAKIEEGVIEMGAYAFAFADFNEDALYNNTVLTSVELPSTLEYIGMYAFENCVALNGIDLSYVSVIDSGAFMNCTGLVNLGGTNNIMYVGEEAFANCTSLTSVNMPNAITLNNAAFRGCESLESAEFESATAIANYVFYDCVELTNVNIESAVVLYSMSFYNCYNLTSIELPNLVRMGEGVFFGTGLTSFNVPASLIEMGMANFAACLDLTEFTVDENNTVFFTDGAGLYRILQSGDYEIMSFAGGRSGIYTVLDGTVRVDDMAFAYATNINAVTLPYTLKSIGARAFYYLGLSGSSVTYTFNSLQAPTLECFNSGSPGSLFDLYSNFTHNLGNVVTDICYPANGTGYDNFVYELYFNVSGLLPDAAEEVTLLVINRIAALDAETATLDEIRSIRGIIDNMSDAQKNLITNYAKFIEIETAMNNVKAEEPEKETLSAAGAAIVSVIATLVVCGAAFALYLRFTKKRGNA